MSRSLRLVPWFALWLALPHIAHAAPPRFTARDAIAAEWDRKLPALDDKTRAALLPGDRARYTLSEQRIGAPGSAPLLLPELDQPDTPTWEALATKARSPEERFTALHLLNRLKSMHALSALDGLTAADGKSWPTHLHLDGQVASARLRGEVVSAQLAALLGALPVEPVRAQAARLRLVLEGKEQALLPPVAPTPGAVLALLDAWNRAPWDVRKEGHLALVELVFGQLDSMRAMAAGMRAKGSVWARIGARPPREKELPPLIVGLTTRLLEGLPDPAPHKSWGAVLLALSVKEIAIRRAAIEALAKLREGAPIAGATAPGVELRQAVLRAAAPLGGSQDVRIQTVLLPSLRKLDPAMADALRDRLLSGSDPIARAVAIEDLADAPTDLEALTARVSTDKEIDSLQALVAALDRWKLAPDRRRALLSPLLGHATWIGRYEAWKALSALDPLASALASPWPKAPPPTAREQVILDEAMRLAEAGKPVRLQISFDRNRKIVLKLDPVNAPINVANLVVLARAKFFDGHRVPRIVPDFVVQLGSPLDTMDGGPGYSVRCEDSLDWYGPGSVGMALGGKDTGGSQLFVTTNATPHLTGRYTRVGVLEDPDRALPILDALELGASIRRVEVLP